jgi:hypothetical protein
MKFKKGNLVKSDFYEEEKDIVRKIISIKKDNGGYRVSADAGKICECCKRPLGKEILGVDSAWFEKVSPQ